MSDATSLYWFDYETFGTHPAWDRPCQFAGVRTDMDLNEIGDPMIIYCRQSADYLPHPAACKVTGLTPQHVNELGLSEATFIERIVKQIGFPGTCSLGYNSIRFDDEFTRHALFRNFFEPYEHEYRENNSRWDLLDVVRLTRALRPEGIEWPFTDEGQPSNRLEHLTKENGIEHGHAHDALSDVRATIGMAKLIRQVQPKLYDYAFNNRGKQAVSQMLKVVEPRVCLLISSMIPGYRAHMAAILPLAIHPDNKNGVIVIDLLEDPSELLTLDADEIARRLFAKNNSDQTPSLSGDNNNTQTISNTPVKPRPGLRTVQINKCPVVVPLNTLREEDADRLGIDLDSLKKHEQIARKLQDPAMRNKIIEAMKRPWPEANPDAEGSLYSGPFLSPEDRTRAAELRKCPPARINDIAAHFTDKRMIELAWRYQARNHPESMNDDERARWQQHCHERLNDESADWLSFAEFDVQLDAIEWDKADLTLRDALQQYRLEQQALIGNAGLAGQMPQ